MIRKILLAAFSLAIAAGVMAQEGAPKNKPKYEFTDIKVLPYTDIKDQARTGTCWSFSGLSFLESEMLRQGKDSVNLSPMWVVRQTYIEKAIKYVRLHGSQRLGQGGAMGDPFMVIRKYGIVPAEVYGGLNYGSDRHNHSEMYGALTAYLEKIVEQKPPLSTAWLKGFTGILDAYLGAAPEKFTYKGKEYTPMSFASSLGLNLDDYYAVTSFTHHPFYTAFAIEIPDNWDWGLSYNIPLVEFRSLMAGAIDKGYTIFWASDVSEKGFNRKDCYAAVPAIVAENVDEADRKKWDMMPAAARGTYIIDLKRPGKEMEITQILRQQAFDNYETTDDHGMHIVGTAKDQNGTAYYKVKNSWGKVGPYKGMYYFSEPYTAYKTISLVVHKDAIPKEIRNRLGIK